MHSTELIKGTLTPLILKLLYEHDKMYGYELTQKIRELSDGKLNLTEGALYLSLHKLEIEEILSSETIDFNGRKRKYYKLTRKGNKVAKERIEEMIGFLKTMTSIMKLKIV